MTPQFYDPDIAEEAFLAPQLVYNLNLPSVTYVCKDLATLSRIQAIPSDLGFGGAVADDTPAPPSKVEMLYKQLEKEKAVWLTLLNTPITVLNPRRDLATEEAPNYPVQVLMTGGVHKGKEGWVFVGMVSPFPRKRLSGPFQFGQQPSRAAENRKDDHQKSKPVPKESPITEAQLADMMRAKSVGLCGAPTLDGTPCKRRVAGGGFCYQHH
ncbi:hypothetical protein V5E97_15430 [Singulisphaera sp. Ch08]|uniref:Uncharacterized protein n=1 Tax=Singulisphaera sp. Ch08 TaxID=3120278 RepID=A0AAU7CRT9_9BACT